MRYNFVVPTLFGLEGLVARELKFMEAEDVSARDGCVHFSGGEELAARANICLRSGERVNILIGCFNALTFDELFDRVRALNWEEYIGREDAFPVKGYSLKSKLYSVSDCQRIIKKAIVERLKKSYRTDWFRENGPRKQVRFSVFKDQVSIMLDTTGDGLHKRGYRSLSAAAPMRETLAAAIVQLSRLRNGEMLLDPFCGAGTLGIEAALYSTMTAPGLKRSFTAESWSLIRAKTWKDERERARSRIRKTDTVIFSSDIDPKAVRLAEANAKKAGIDSKNFRISVKDVNDITPPFSGGVIAANPPYGERLMEMKKAEELYRQFGSIYRSFENTRAYVLTSHENFEQLFGKKADKNRKLYNGMIKCYLYQYLGK